MSRPAQTITDPAGLDRALTALQGRISAVCPWLDNVYGEAEALILSKGKSRPIVLAVYAGNNDYIEAMPDERVGSFTCFIADRLTADSVKTGSNPAMQRYSADVSLVAFWHYEKAFPGKGDSNTVRHVEALLINALTSTQDRQLTFELTGVETRFEKVFAPAKTATSDPILSRRPYGYLRINGNLIFNPAALSCYDIAQQPAAPVGGGR